MNIVRKNQYKKNSVLSDFVIALMLNLFFFLLVLFFCDIKYEVSDDFVIETILSGAYGGEINPRMLFVNVILGHLLGAIYHVIPGISWYFVFQIFLGFISFTSVTYFLMKKLPRLSAIIISTLFILFFSDDIYILIQFTKTSVLAVMSGSLLFLWGVFAERICKKMIFIGGVLVIAGSLLRFNSVYLAAPFILLILLIEIISIWVNRKEDKKWYQRLCKIGLIGMLLIVCVFSLEEINTQSYIHNANYKEFAKYNQVRSTIVDYPNYGYWIDEEAYRALGLSENDFNMLVRWNFADNEVFNIETMKKVSAIMEERRNKVEILETDVLRCMEERNYEKYSIFWACAILGILTIICNKKNWWKVFACGLLGGDLLFYYFYVGRVVYRVEYGVYLCAFMFLMYYFKLDEKIKNNKIVKNIGLSLIAVLCILKIPLYIPDTTYKQLSDMEYNSYVNDTFFYSENYDRAKYCKVINKRDIQEKLISYMQNNRRDFFFMDFSTTIQTLYLDVNPIEVVPKDYYDNMLYLAGVTTNYPDVKEKLKMAGYENPLKCLVEENVYVVDNVNYEMKLLYLQEHYYPNAKMKLYKEIDGYKIWKYYVK
ncbi:MAG: hypothetical protein RSA90_00105 [Lachnospiraceae bacterium]